MSPDSRIGLPALRPVQENYPHSPLDAPRSATLSDAFYDDERCYTAASQYLESVIPGIEVEPVSNKGTTAVVMRDEERRAYKVFRYQQRDYTLVENEAVALSVMGREGVAPRLIALFDAARHHRYSNRSGHSIMPLFKGQVAVPYIEGTGPLPVIITEFRELVPITDIPNRLLVPEFRRIAAAMVKHSLLIADGEIMYDPVNEQAVAVDWGYARHPDPASMESDIHPQSLVHEATLVYDAFVRFCPPYARKPSAEDIARKLADGGVANLDTLLHEHCEK